MIDTAESRQSPAASANGRPSDFGSGNGGSTPPAAANLHFDYGFAEDYAKQIKLGWLGTKWLVAFDTEAHALGMTQEQVDMVFRHHLWHIRLLSDPQTYSWLGRIAMALHFLTGWKVVS